MSGTELYRDIRRVRNPSHVPRVFIYRFHASLNFANSERFQASLYLRTVKNKNVPNGPLHTIVIDFRRDALLRTAGADTRTVPSMRWTARRPSCW